MIRTILTLSVVVVGLVACGKSEAPPAASGAAPTEVVAATTAEPTKAEPATTNPVEPTAAKAELGKPAPDFALTDVDGKPFKLSDHRGKTVVLEWFNPGCPFVKYAYNEGPLKKQARETVSDEVLWVNINSGAPGKQGHGIETNRAARAEWGIPGPVLIDEEGVVGRMYEARTTPHMYIVDPAGTLVYRGGIDNAPLGNPKGGAAVVNHVAGALANLAAGAAISTPETEPYGCSVKYASK